MISPRLAIWILVALLGATGCRKPREEQPPIVIEAKPAPTRTSTRTTKLPSFDLWYRIQADGQPIGYRHVSLSTPTSQQGSILVLRSDQRTRITAGSQPATQRLRLTERCAPNGALISTTTERKTASKTIRRKYVVRGQTLETIDPDSGTRTSAALPKGPPVSGLCGLYLAMLEGASSRALRTLDTATGKLVTGHVLRTPGSNDQYRYAESNQPQVKTVLFLGPSRLPVKMTVTGLGVTLRLTLSTRVEANQALDKAPRKPARGQAVDLHARIPDPLEASRIRYALTFPSPLPATALAELSRGNQRRLPGGNATHTVIEVTRPVPLPSIAALPYPPTPSTLRPAKAWLHRSTPALSQRDTRRAQLGVLLRGTATAMRAVLRLTSWAAIAPTRGFKDRAGLLVASLRAAGIPARLVYGFLYVGSVMTEHTWVEAWLGGWLALDPEIGRAAGPTHLRLATSPADPSHHPDTTWRKLEPLLRGLRARLVDATLGSGFRFVPGARTNANQNANVLYHRVWNLVVRRPFTARFVMPGKADTYELAVITKSAALRLELRLFAASAEGLDPASFRAMGYRSRKIGLRDYLVRDLKSKAFGKPTTPAPKPKNRGKPIRRSYVQIACSPKPWGARLVRWTLTGRIPDAKTLAALEAKVLGTFQMTGHPAGTTACTPTRHRKSAP